MHSKGGRASCLWLLRAVLLAITRADMIGILVSVRSRFAHGMSCMREEQHAERKCCVSWRGLRRNLSIGVSLTSLTQSRRAAEAEPSSMRGRADRQAGELAIAAPLMGPAARKQISN
jgi:hypothetical protein